MFLERNEQGVVYVLTISETKEVSKTLEWLGDALSLSGFFFLIEMAVRGIDYFRDLGNVPTTEYEVCLIRKMTCQKSDEFLIPFL